MHLLPVHPPRLLEDILRPQVAAIQAPMEEEEATEAVKEEMAVVRTIIEARKEASLADVRPPRVIHDEITTAIPLAQFRRIMAPHHKVHLQVIVQQQHPLAKQLRQDTVDQLLRQPPQTTQLRPLMATVLPLLLAMVPQITVMICLPMAAARNNQMVPLTTYLTTTYYKRNTYCFTIYCKPLFFFSFLLCRPIEQRSMANICQVCQESSQTKLMVIEDKVAPYCTLPGPYICLSIY